MREIFVKDRLRSEIEEESQGANTVLYDVRGYPSIMVVVPSFNLEEIDPKLGSGLHPAFIVNGIPQSEILIGKYQAHLLDGAAMSLPRRDPTTRVTYDEALNYCAVKGPGWHLMTNVEWAAVALWCWKNGFLPRGNNDYGRSWERSCEAGTFQPNVDPRRPRTDVWSLTGSGPDSWNHDKTPWGIADLNGNVSEWVGGLRLVDGEIQVIPHNNAALNTTNQDVQSAAWHGILENGDLVPPHNEGTFKFDCDSSFTFDNAGAPLVATDIDNRNDPNLCDDGYASCMFATLLHKPGISDLRVLKKQALYPINVDLSKEEFGAASLWLRNYGERLPCRGGNFYTGYPSGIFALDMNSRRNERQPATGFRPAFVRNE